ncbi:M20/M25/M40 family metallo-hydrolase [Sphingobium sp. 3R8]|uniref:M20/M25/M40 family metallo-hydrolase n=1 Tax=Sphingobium sp. 3R8 TaxID=2874921 RepID=UPI001CCCD410|nr:M20/M25/M40 family metallo-hydrolase [Sphingobium sp. 3R8]MBZ9647515.1 M20/M25/M40 family metallo-hydrolase [Sphingobium sp. 3R8]
MKRLAMKAMLAGAALSLSVGGLAQSSAPLHSPADARILATIKARPAVKAALAALESEHDQWVDTIVALTQIPAPPFKEGARAKAYAERFRAAGLADVEIDEVGNVLGLRRGTGKPGGKLVVVSAHLDTVFPEGTDVTVRREGNMLHAPGVGDDVAGLATQLSLIKALAAGKIATPMDILFVGDVGEEGLGDLRGIKHLFREGKYKDRIAAFFSIDDGSVDGLTNGGVGSKRYRLTFKGPGGHSFGAFGLVNPLTAMSQAIVNIYGIAVPASPKTTYSASVVGGGSSVNAIPSEAWLQLDMRSESAAELAKLERAVLAQVDAAAASENKARSTRDGAVSVDKMLIGDRPAGMTGADTALVRQTAAAYATEGVAARLSFSSTDANVPMNLGIPAITISRAATGGRGHSLDEWIDISPRESLKVKRMDLLAILAAAGLR